MGAAFTCLPTLASKVMLNRGSGETCLCCKNCGYKGDTLVHIGEYIDLKATGPFQDNRCESSYISDFLGWHLSDLQKISKFPCPRRSCATGSLLVLNVSMNKLPYIMCVFLNKQCFINEMLSYFNNEFDTVFRLRGIVYGDGNHFVARIVMRDGRIWFHDGIVTGSKCTYEGKLDEIPDVEWLMTSSRGYSYRTAILAVYARD